MYGYCHGKDDHQNHLDFSEFAYFDWTKLEVSMFLCPSSNRHVGGGIVEKKHTNKHSLLFKVILTIREIQQWKTYQTLPLLRSQFWSLSSHVWKKWP